MVKLKSPIYTNRETRVRGEIIKTNEVGETEVSEETAELLLSGNYPWMAFELDGVNEVFSDEIEKVEKEDLTPIEKGEDIQTPSEDTKTPAEIIEEESKEVDSDVKEMIEATDSFDELKSIAEMLELPKAEWEGYKRKDYFKNYLLGKVSE